MLAPTTKPSGDSAIRGRRGEQQRRRLDEFPQRCPVVILSVTSCSENRGRQRGTNAPIRIDAQNRMPSVRDGMKKSTKRVYQYNFSEDGTHFVKLQNC